MYVNTLGATAGCYTQAQHDEAVSLCGCVRRGTEVLQGFGAASPYTSDAYVGIELPTAEAPKCLPTIPMPADFDPKDPCAATARTVCKPGLTRPTQDGSSSSPSSEPEEYEDTIVSGAMMKQQILVFGILGLVLAGGGYMVYRVVKKG